MYKWIIDDVIEKAHRVFAETGIDEAILQELQQIWEQNIVTMKVTPQDPIVAAHMSHQQSHTISQNDGPLDIPQKDGADEEDDDDDDEAAINSDLDESNSEDEEVETSNIILCQYEKVWRVKNKWKCIFKDGIMNVNGKDYLFNRANGEFEW